MKWHDIVIRNSVVCHSDFSFVMYNRVEVVQMVTLTDWVRSWIDRRSIRLAASTISGYRGHLRKYITPSLVGNMAIDQITDIDLIMLLSPIVGVGHTRAAQLLQILVGAALRDAVRRRIIPFNPMDWVDKIEHNATMTAWLQPNQASKLLATAESDGDPLYVAWLLGICCGLRRGEIMGLMWVDVDIQGRIIHVRRQRVNVDGRTVQSAPKTDAGTRDIAITGTVAAALKDARQADARYVVGGLQPVGAKQISAGLARACAAAGVPRITPHGMRHTMAAAAASAGVPIKVLQLIMGHAQYTTTANIYAHVDYTAQRNAAQTISAAFLCNDYKNGARLEIV